MRRGAYFFADCPLEDATSAAVLWQPHACPHVLPLTARPAEASAGDTVFRLPDLRLPTTLVRGPDGVQHVLIRDGVRALQLVVDGACLLSPVHLVTSALAGRSRLRVHLHALECLNHLQTTGSLPDQLLPADPRGRRQRAVLQALDGWRASACHRDIAAALFGAPRVTADWRDPRDHLRDQVRRAIRRGRALMGGGYRQLLL